MIYHTQLREVLMIGCTPTSGSTSDVHVIWGWNGEQWHRVAEGGPQPSVFGSASSTSTFSSLSDKTWKLANGAWSELSLENHPAKRGSPAVAYHPDHKRIVLYGGFASDRSDLNDTWEWDGSQWQCIVNCQ
ncbi:MAG TPA: hypothetical protein VMN99_12385 [Anaerolineales bacterium]|nr:hypothetical protein [Anaerolineales bacterium]